VTVLPASAVPVSVTGTEVGVEPGAGLRTTGDDGRVESTVKLTEVATVVPPADAHDRHRDEPRSLVPPKSGG
jgi:hypothetical protein